MWPFNDMSLPTATLVGTIANWCLLASLLTGVVSTFVIVKTADVKETHWDRDRDAANERIGELAHESELAKAELGKANAEIEDAKKQAAELNKEASEAKERTASLEKEAAQAKLEQERLKQIVSWRTISNAAGNKMVALLKANPAFIKLAYVAADPEALGLAIQFSKVLEIAGWTVAAEAMTFSSKLILEFRIPGPENEAVESLRKALNEAGIPFSTEDVPPPDMAFVQSGANPPAATLFIGSKRPPF
jgi:F0F1-type ATP synthase membrane subunit b/b'